ncbi:MAG: two-component system, chemotaxis family, sensor kinase CheA [Euryarchaeota archaeon]|nr:two-component system, chemotaxis family, sensor kinase CheA [Euryarchaeota archaeon]
MDTDMAAYKDDFLQELYECLDIYNQSFVDLENGDSDAVNEIFRVTHTIKGMAGFLRYSSLESLCHSMEEVLGGIKNGDIEIDGDLIDIMLSAVDKITEMVRKIESEDNDKVNIEDLLKAFNSYRTTGERKQDISRTQKPVLNNTKPPQVTNIQTSKSEISSESGSNNDQQTENAPGQEDKLILDVDLTADCVAKSLRAALVIESLKDICKVSKTIPDEDEMEGSFNGHFTVFLSGDREEVEELMDRISEIEKFSITSNEKADNSDLVLEEKEENQTNTSENELVPESQLEEDQILKENLEARPVQNSNLQKMPKAEKLELDSNFSPPESENSKNVSSDTKRNETIRVSIANLDKIMNLVGELVINKGRLLQIAQQHNIPELNEATGTLDKSISSLQNEVMRTRMVRIERVFSKFPRMVRDLSRKLDKNIDFAIEGEDTELDRTILDEISDPLVHLVRNAVDHGVEAPQERLKNGKSSTGRILLSARREKNNVIIEIEDDGKGLDLELLKKKTLEKGILSQSEIDNLSDDEVRMLIFVSGLSTKEKVTEISGRGVGMDAVRTAVEKLGGKVRVYSKKGEFTKIRIDLPPTVAIIKSLLIEVGPEIYAIPISNVVKALSVDIDDYKLVKGIPLLYVKNKLIPIVELKETFNIKCEKSGKEIAIIVEKENEEVGLIVDSIIDQQEIVIKPLTKIFSNSKGFSGVTILGDGRVIPILDVSTLIRDDIDD